MPQFTDHDKAIIENDYLEKGWNAYTIWKEHPTKGWDRVSVWRLLDKFIKTGSMDRKKGSGRPVTATTDENMEVVEDLICSQEENPGTHDAPRKIEEKLGISRSSVKRLVKRNELNQFKRIKEPRRDKGQKHRRSVRASGLVEKFRKNARTIEKLVWQDEKDFTLEVPVNTQNDRVYFRGCKSDVPEERLMRQTKRQCKKVMISAAISWHGVTRPFFVNEGGIKVNAVRYHQHLKRELFPAIEKFMTRGDWIFVQDGASSHTSDLVQGFLSDTLKNRFVRKDEWPPSSPDSNPLDYYFWNQIKLKVYEGRPFNQPFRNEQELMARIKAVWKDCAKNIPEIRKAVKQFIPRLEAVSEKQGGSIKMLFG